MNTAMPRGGEPANADLRSYDLRYYELSVNTEPTAVGAVLRFFAAPLGVLHESSGFRSFHICVQFALHKTRLKKNGRRHHGAEPRARDREAESVLHMVLQSSMSLIFTSDADGTLGRWDAAL